MRSNQFSEVLMYEDGTSNKQYNGNISYQKWGTKDRRHVGKPRWEAGKAKTDNGNVRRNTYGKLKLENACAKNDLKHNSYI